MLHVTPETKLLLNMHKYKVGVRNHKTLDGKEKHLLDRDT